jgi:heat shock protein HslJ
MRRTLPWLAVVAAAAIVGCAPKTPPAVGRADSGEEPLDDRQAAPGSTSEELWGTSWLLEDLAGTGVVDRVQATLTFPEPGKIAGKGSCNQFFGDVQLAGRSIVIGSLGATRMACAEAVNDQERRYFEALQHAERWGVEGRTLSIWFQESEAPLRFTRTGSSTE